MNKKLTDMIQQWLKEPSNELFAKIQKLMKEIQDGTDRKD